MFWLAAAFLVGYYFYTRLTCPIAKSSTCLLEKTAIITGANSGLGYQTALNLASRGCKVIMADVADMEESRKNIIKYTNNPNIHAENLDLSSLESVREFARKILQTESRLDILINNAGIIGLTGSRTKDGLHSTMQINYFGHFLLTHLLIDLLKKSAPSRIVFCTSCALFVNNLSVENLNFDNQRGSISETIFGYSNSKLASLIASDIFARKLKDAGVTSNNVHPGCVATPIFRGAYDFFTSGKAKLLFIRLCSPIYIKEPWEGAQTLVHAAVSKKLERVSGEFFWDCKPCSKPGKAYDKEFCQRIWEASERYVDLKPEEKLTSQ